MKILPIHKSRGFTLIELLVALTIVAILAVSVFVALNPAQRLKDAKNARRATDVDTILSAIHEYTVDNKGSLPASIAALGNGEANDKQLGENCGAIATTHCATTALECISTFDTEIAAYLKSIPIDPDTTLGTPGNTGYVVEKSSSGIITVKACYTDGTTTISASR